MKKVTTLFIFLVSILMACSPTADTPPPDDQPDLTGTKEELPPPSKSVDTNQSQTNGDGLKITLHRVEATETGVIVHLTFENTSKKTIKVPKKPNIYFHTPDNLLIHAANKPLQKYEEKGMKPGSKLETDIFLNAPVGSRLIPEEIKEMTIVFGSSASFDVRFK
ncbi:hypothetical protein GCM10007416_00840 [Kroppenstedtia guangzhouensis]|jgi:hypothetical protein|uniref:DUF4352 domain-containing protein n=1 Tax=Kroppenstedtia guangzhouensis TaxID=1274356 RepID=A0ABQ1FWM9_9BACL|nr:hypothetical protein [Kroppenstedtia guangzhouensis]GGA32098.1 hypothetical protein GCM10007416_00840 [Kroppenstedtia guangzhouensis]